MGSYPITPATDIMQELAARKDMGVKVVQCEDEISGICTAIGASFAGNLAATNTSGTGWAFKSVAIGLAVIAELPWVIIDVRRGGPSTGLPTKTEQTDLLQALYGRNGESPCVVLAASTPDNCFDYAFVASKLAMEHMTPVILLTDAFIGNGSSLWKMPKLAELSEIHPHIAGAVQQEGFNSTKRDEDLLVRYWAFPGMAGFMHRNGGLEKDYLKASISTDGANHAPMVNISAEKVAKIADCIPALQVEGDASAETLVIGWGSTHGHLLSAVTALNAEGHKTALAHFNYMNPLPKNTAEAIGNYQNVVVGELKTGEFGT